MQIGIGKWKTANGEMVEITFHSPGDNYPWRGTLSGKTRTWKDSGRHCESTCGSAKNTANQCPYDIIGPWEELPDQGIDPDSWGKGQEEGKPLNLMELPVGTWLKLRNGEKRRLNGMDGKAVYISGGVDGLGVVARQPNGLYGYSPQSNLDVVGIWEEPKRRTVWIEVTLHNDGDFSTASSEDLADLKPATYVVSRRYVKVELVEGEFDPLPEDQ